MEQMAYEYWFANVKGISGERKSELRKKVSAEALYYMEETAQNILSQEEKKKLEITRKEKDWEKDFEQMKRKGISFFTCMQAKYPKVLAELKGMPYALYYKGNFPEDGFSAAIVGARRCTPYGERMTLVFAEALAERNITIISGLARGIDGIAHRGALNVSGTTIAVLGSGVDVCYPREHIGLYKDIEERGCLISEYPPGTPPIPSHFPARNRIISALSNIVLVMEAKEKSGSLITADLALEQGKDVYALPGMIDNELSKGCHKLIAEGAGILCGVGELYEEIGLNDDFSVKFGEKKEAKNKIMLERDEILVYSCLRQVPKKREEIFKETGLSPQTLSGILVTLELNGFIKERSGYYYIRAE